MLRHSNKFTQVMIFNSSSEPKEAICFKQHNDNNVDFRIFLTQYISQFFKMHSLYVMWLYDLRFLNAKLYLFVFDVTFAASNEAFTQQMLIINAIY